MSEYTPRITGEMLFVVSTTGDGCNSTLAQGREELRAAVLAAIWMGTLDEAPDDVIETLDSLDNPGEEWCGGYYPDRDPFWSWHRSYEDGSVTVQRVMSCPPHDRRVAELLAANNREVERRRVAEDTLRTILRRLERTCAETWVDKSYPGGLADFIRAALDA